MSANDVVITGIGGRFPDSNNIEEFKQNLFNGVDMINDSRENWTESIYGMNNRIGRVKHLDRFYHKFFGIMNEELLEEMKPEAKMLLETTYEAIIDAGVNPQSLANSRTGVYIGNTILDFKHIQQEINESPGFPTRFMATFDSNIPTKLANRISFLFNFKGPSIVIDTGCSASMSALAIAVNDMLLDNIDFAIVGGCQITLDQFTYATQQAVGMCSKRGVSAVLDQSADGYVKGDCVAVIFLQKRSSAKRVYARVLSVQLNEDGKKLDGMHFPSSKAQEELMIMTLKKTQINPLDLTYIEAHGTGTEIGDYQEVKAIHNAYCGRPNRTKPLPLGLLKSNIGHTEGASGVAAIIKVILCFECESLPKNLNLNAIKEEIKQFCPPLHPNTERISYEPGLAAINNFGIGGANAHTLLEPNYKHSSDDKIEIIENIPRIVNICGRTEEAVRHVFDFIENNADIISSHFFALLTDTMKIEPDIKSDGFPFRGSLIIEKLSENESGIRYKYTKLLKETTYKMKRELWFMFPGLGEQWPAMAKALMPIKVFADKIEECHQILSEFKVDLKKLLFSEDKRELEKMSAKFCATTALQIALFEVLKELDITPDGIIGHSFGEIACAYADGCLTTKQAMVVTHSRGFTTENDEHIPKGLMAVCGLSKEEAERLIPPEVVVACNNSKQFVVLSGLEKEMQTIISALERDNIFCRQLEAEMPYHSKYMMSSAQPMADIISEFIPNPKRRSKKWISTAITEEETDEEFKFASAQYFKKNLVSPVHFDDKLKHIPSNAIVIELSPHFVFKNIFNERLEDSNNYINLLTKNSNDKNLFNFLSAITKLYELGFNPSIEKLYTPVNWPVCRGTPSISSLMEWDHNRSFPVKQYPESFNNFSASDLNVKLDLTSEDKYLMGHCVDQDILFPATGYLVLAWRQLAVSLRRWWTDVPVIFENVQFIRPVFLSLKHQTVLKVRYSQISYEFEILNNGYICAQGKMHCNLEDTLSLQSLFYKKYNSILENEVILTKDDIYTDLRVRDYHYSGLFEGLKSIRTNFQEIIGTTEWKGNIIAFLDTILQIRLFDSLCRQTRVPTSIKYIRLDPKLILDCVNHNRYCLSSEKQMEEKESHQLFMGSEEQFNQLDDSHKIKRFCRFRSSFSFYFNPNTNIIVGPGLEIEGIHLDLLASKNNPADLVLDSYEFVTNNEIITENTKDFIRRLTDIVSENNVKNYLTVTEINMQKSTQHLIEHVRPNMTNYNICLTAIDYNLVIKAMDENEQNIKSLCKNIIIWNNEEHIHSPLSDLIILNDSQELRTISTQILFKDLFESLKQKGFLLIVYRYGDEVSEELSSDLETRVEDVLRVTKMLGFTLICHKYDSNGTTALLLRKSLDKNHPIKSQQIIEITNDRNYVWFEKLKHEMISNKETDNANNIWLIARDTPINGILGLINCLRLEPGGEFVRCIIDYDNSIELPIDWNSKHFSDIITNDLIINVIKDGKLGTYRHLKLPEDYDKTDSNEYFLNLTQTKDLSSVLWFDGRSVVKNNDFYAMNGIKSDLVNVQIYCSGLIFQDVMLALGQIQPDTISEFDDCWIGCEFVGRRADTNQRVMGFEISRCFSTSINARKNMFTDIPDHWSMEDAITILNYATVWYGLIYRADLKRGESVLIHSGTGAVEQSAINVCKHFGCDIYVTVGSEEKKAFLIREYNIPENRIFSSRNIQFKSFIIELTNGKGVDIVLNSLAGPLLEASYECVSTHGRIVELGKYDLEQNKQFGINVLRRGISLLMIDINSCLMSFNDFTTKFFDWMHNNSTNGCVKPLNKIVFNANEAENAFRFMTTEKHIGKIVIRIRDEEENRGSVKPLPATEMRVFSKIYFNPNKVYIITGGLGGFGLQLIQWMSWLGAKKFILTSRSGLIKDYQKFIIKQLESRGQQNKYFKVNIKISQNDCLTIESTRRVISQAKELGEIGGVFHLGVILNDSSLENSELDEFCQTIDTKYKVLNNLDVESRQLNYNLDLFVVFSSITCGKGNAGQTNYAVGNALCERICEQRRSDGLHGLAIQFGGISDVGALSQIKSPKLFDIEDQSISSCLNVLGRLLLVRHSIVTSYLWSNKGKQSIDEDQKFGDFWRAIGVDPDKTPDNFTLGEIGIESMFAVKLQQEFTRVYSLQVTLAHIKMISVKMLKEYEKGNQEYMKQFFEGLRLVENKLKIYKYIIPSENQVRLNNISEGKPVYFLSPFEITFSAYKTLADKMDRPVIGLNWTKTMNKFKSFEEISNYYSKILQKLEPNGKYDLLGSFDGMFVILDLFNKGLVNNAVAIDVLSSNAFKEDKDLLSKECAIEPLLSFLCDDCPCFFKEMLVQISQSEENIESKIRRIVQSIKEIVGHQLISNDIEEILQIAVKRINIIADYQTENKAIFVQGSENDLAQINGRLSIIRPISLTMVNNINFGIEKFRNTQGKEERITIDVVDINNPFDVNSESIVNKIIDGLKY